MLVLNVRVREEDDIVIMRGLEFPNVIVQGKTREESQQEFFKALECYFMAKAKIENEECSPLQKEETEVLRMELIVNERTL